MSLAAALNLSVAWLLARDLGATRDQADAVVARLELSDAIPEGHVALRVQIAALCREEFAR